MIPKIIHYVWLGRGPKPELVEQCIASWHHFMPDWQYMEWNEDTIEEYCNQQSAISNLQSPIYTKIESPIFDLQYCAEAYAARKYAFVSDYVRLWALEKFGGLYMDVDFEVYKSFEDLLDCPEGAFVGREGSKHQPPMLGVMASEVHGKWVTEMMRMYDDRKFKIADCKLQSGFRYDMTTNVAFFAAAWVHKPEWVKIYPVEYFCPMLTTGEDVRLQSEECRLHNYCEHKGLHSWSDNGDIIHRVKVLVLGMVGAEMKTKLIKLKRKLLG